MSDFAFLNAPPKQRTRQEHYNDIQRESLKVKLKHIANDTEQATDYCRSLIRGGADVSDELTELETTARGLLLVVGLLRRETANG